MHENKLDNNDTPFPIIGKEYSYCLRAIGTLYIMYSLPPFYVLPLFPHWLSAVILFYGLLFVWYDN